jgi:hypothetical protein
MITKLFLIAMTLIPHYLTLVSYILWNVSMTTMMISNFKASNFLGFTLMNTYPMLQQNLLVLYIY